MRNVKTAIEKVIHFKGRVLIQGAAGTGKELVARKGREFRERNGQICGSPIARKLTRKTKLILNSLVLESIQDGRRVVGLFEQAHLGTAF